MKTDVNSSVGLSKNSVRLSPYLMTLSFKNLTCDGLSSWCVANLRFLVTVNSIKNWSTRSCLVGAITQNLSRSSSDKPTNPPIILSSLLHCSKEWSTPIAANGLLLIMHAKFVFSQAQVSGSASLSLYMSER